VTGRVLQLNVKPQTPGEPGLPKRPVPTAQIQALGVEGDFNDWRTENLPGDLQQAVLLVTTELLTQLREEGWPVAPGDLGENITLSGIPEAALGVAARLAIGGVLLEITKPCDPCIRLYNLPYVGSEGGPAFLRATAGRRGWYARVVQPGMLERGAVVSLLSPSASSSAAT
jgi:MOSC domain-containing protein YiiM